MRLVLTSPARNDLKSIAAYTRKQWGAEQARRYNAQLFTAMSGIAEHRIKGKKHYDVPEAVKGYTSGRHVIFYRTEEEAAYIVRILHESMDHGRHLP